MNRIIRLRTLWDRLPDWLRRLLIVAALIGLALVALAFLGPREVQLAAVAALIGLFLLVQAIVLGRLSRQNPAFRQARRAFLQGDFESAVTVLEAHRAAGRADAMSDTLLGNAYRQLGRLHESEEVLRAAYETDPRSPFPAFGLGRTLLVQGRYADAADLMAYALEARGPATISADLGHAQVRAGRLDEAAQSLRQADEIELEPHRALLTAYLRHQIAGQPPDDALIRQLRRYEHGLEAWRAEVRRFGSTPYGAALAQDVASIERLLEV